MIGRFLHGRVLVPAYESIWKRRSTFRYHRQLNRSQWFSRERLELLQFEALRRLLVHAIENSPYYRQTWLREGLDPRRLQSFEDFSRWPLIDREVIREHRHRLRAAAPPMRLISKSTGGSTGVPVHFDLNSDSNDRRMAAWHRGYGWAGAGPGTKQFYLWGVPLGAQSLRQRSKDALYHWLYRRRVVSSFALTDDCVEGVCRRLNGCRPDAIVAYTNPLYWFARALQERGIVPFSPRSIVVGAEKLHGFQRELIERVFGAPVFETYGSREFMLIGGECDRHAGLHLTSEHLLVELVDDDGKPTVGGEEGNVVVTDLYNYGMPFIRYSSGDRAVASPHGCACGRGLPLLARVVGRRLDMLHTPDGRRVPGEFFPHLVKDFPAVRRFQVVQDGPGRVEMRLVVAEGWDASVRQQLAGLVRRVLGPEVEFALVEVESIPLTPAGKLRVVINRCAPHMEPAVSSGGALHS